MKTRWLTMGCLVLSLFAACLPGASPVEASDPGAEAAVEQGEDVGAQGREKQTVVGEDSTSALAADGGTTERASLASNGRQGNGVSGYATLAPDHPGLTISADGRYVAFVSEATNLVSGDTNDLEDIFVRDRQTGQTTRVSVTSAGTQANGRSWHPAISPDGRYVLFQSPSSNLVSDDTNVGFDVFVRDRQTGQTGRVSVGSDGSQGDGDSERPAISADGRYVVFHSDVSNLVSGDTNGVDDVLIRDRQKGQTRRLSLGTGGSEGNGRSSSALISADGRYVAFYSEASNMVSGDTNGTADVFVYDRQTGQTKRVSVASGGSQANGWSSEAAISADGRYVAYTSYASNLVPGDTNGAGDVFVRDLQAGQTARVSTASDGAQGNADSGLPAISSNGRYVAFRSSASNLVAGDTNGKQDIFIKDRETGQTQQVSVAAGGGQANGGSGFPALSADGRYVVFCSVASNLVSGDTNGVADVFVRDRGADPLTYTVSGRVKDGSENGIQGVTVSAGGGYSATTLASGLYAITGLITGTYTITPSKSGYSFSPPSRTVSVPLSRTGQDFMGTTMAMWDWWGPRVIDEAGHDAEREALLQFCTNPPKGSSNPIGAVYMYVPAEYLTDGTKRQNLRSLLGDATQRHIGIHWLNQGSDSEIFRLASAGSLDNAKATIDRVIDFNKASDSTQRFAGIHLDVEVADFNPGWRSLPEQDRKAYWDRYFNLLEHCRASISSYNRDYDPDMVLGIDLATYRAWYATSTYMPWQQSENDYWHTALAKADVLTTMDYVDHCDDRAASKGLATRARDAIEYAGTLGKKVVIGIETDNVALKDLSRETTFYEEGWRYMEGELSKLASTFSDSSGFGGIAVHDYDTYEAMQEAGPAESGSQVLLEDTYHLAQGALRTVILTVPGGQQLVSFVSQWTGSTIEMILTDPSGRTITPDTASADSDVKYYRGDNLEMYVVTSAVAGNWSVQLRATDVPVAGEDVALEVSGVSSRGFLPIIMR